MFGRLKNRQKAIGDRVALLRRHQKRENSALCNLGRRLFSMGHINSVDLVKIVGKNCDGEPVFTKHSTLKRISMFNNYKF